MALALSGQAVDPTTQVAYALVSRTLAPVRGPYVLECIGLRTGLIRKGPVFRAGDLTVASGYLWVYGAARSGTKPSISQVDLRSLRVVRTIRLPGTLVPAYPLIHLAPGPGHSVWAGLFQAGSVQALQRLSTRTGAALTTVRLPAHLVASDLSADPARGHLYVSAAHVVRGGVEGSVVIEYDARSGRRLALADSGLITDSVAGAALTAVPGGVWATFRTGMLGLTIHLRQRGLAMIAPPGPRIALLPATGIFHWPMYEAATYGGGVLWVANQAGIVACLDPRTGKPRATERVSQQQLIYQLLAADPLTRQLYGIDAHGLAALSPPPRCWSSPA
jgi:hypothetical protein